MKRTVVLRRLLASTLLFVFTVGLAAQQAPASPSAKPQETPTFKARTDLVLVPVTVDKGNKPVTGLTKDNFVIEEDGKDMPVAVFEAVTTASNKRLAKKAPSNQFDNFDEDKTPRSMMMIAIDAINTPMGYQEETRKNVLKFLSKNVNPNQLTSMVVMTSKGVRMISDFTSNTEVLIAALQSASGQGNRYGVTQRDLAREQHGSVEGQTGGTMMDNRGEPIITGSSFGAPVTPVTDTSPQDQQAKMMNFIAKAVQDYLKGEDKVEQYQLKNRIRSTLEIFQQIAQGLIGYPGRKSLIWCSASFPAALEPNRFNDMELMSVYERTLKLLADANVVVYPVDIKGIQISSPGADATLSPEDRLARVDPAARYKEDSLKMATFRDFAERTGGRAYFDINGNDKAFQDAFGDSDSYYMLGYYINPTGMKEGWHKLKVRLKNADGKVRSRTGFFVTPATTNPEVSRKNDLSVGARSPFDYTAIPLSGEFGNISGDGPKKKVAFMLRVEPQANVVDTSSENQINLDFIAVARKPNTEVADQSARNIATKLKPESVAQITKDGIAYKNTLELEPGQYEVRFLVRDNITGRMGSVLAPINIK